MFRPSRLAAVVAASLAFGLSWVTPYAYASRSGPGPDPGPGSVVPELLEGVPLPEELPAPGGVPHPGGVPLPGDALPPPAEGLPGLFEDGLPLPDDGPPGPPEGIDDPLAGDPLGSLDDLSPGSGLNVLLNIALSGAITIL